MTASGALEILKKLAVNDQFNLVVVYTKGIAGGIRDVHEQIAMALAYREWSEPLSAGRRDTISSLIQDWEVEDGSVEVGKELLGYLSTRTYFQYRSGLLKFEGSDLESPIENFLLRCPEEVRNKVQYFDAGNGDKGSVKLHPKLLFEYAVVLKHQELYGSLSTDDYGSIACDFETDFNWFTTGQDFCYRREQKHDRTGYPRGVPAEGLREMGTWTTPASDGQDAGTTRRKGCRCRRCCSRKPSPTGRMAS